ncbi:oligoribonuclease [Aurantimicrobium minutum]|uniref:oligoribonuclease n=1 Tax=Aurantimicrobium minutum TaxID=708131 RepID=UPI0024751DAA|nr:oligoribonuclease [Aurantimicrobium minutum]MDH6277543.1 oligoribonuclease [Aurantimicrobium minutum]
MGTPNEYMVWIDCEMTGLNLDVDELVEVAVIITDSELKAVHEGFDIVINPSQAALENMGEFVTNMHTSSGLIEEIPHGVSLEEAEAQVLAYINEHVPEGQKPPMCGNSIGTDRAFVVRYMPLVDARLHYRNIDVSSLKELARRWYPRVYFNSPSKDGGHRALADIQESIRELDYYRQALLVAAPGPNSDEAAKISADIVTKHTS